MERPRFLVEDGRFREHLVWLPHVPKAWRSFVRKCLHDNAADRYLSVPNMLDAISQLPVEPDWGTQVGTKTVSWSRTRGKRRVETIWNRAEDGRTIDWQATSYPLGDGRPRRLDGSTRRPELVAFLRRP